MRFDLVTCKHFLKYGVVQVCKIRFFTYAQTSNNGKYFALFMQFINIKDKNLQYNTDIFHKIVVWKASWEAKLDKKYSLTLLNP